MYRKFIFITIAISLFLVSGLSYAATSAKPAAKASAAAPAKPAKATESEDEKYAQVYEKCTKEADRNEAKYDQLFNSCMEKNGFPQEEYETGGQPMGAIDGQE